MFCNLPFYTLDESTILAFVNNENLNFQTDWYQYFSYQHESAGEIKFRYVKYKYFNLSIVVKYDANNRPISLKSKGSFHYLKNKGSHNADIFDFEEAVKILRDFTKTFQIDLNRLKLGPPEFSVLIVPDLSVVEIVRNIICENRKMFVNNKPGSPSKISGSTANDFRLKTYSKYHEFPQHCAPNTFKIELQAKKMRAFTKNGISTLADLLQFDKWLYIKELHLNYFRQVVIYDPLISLPKKSKFKKELANFRNPNYWERLIEQCKQGKIYRTKYNEKVMLLRNLSKLHGCNLHEQLIQLIEYQWSKFLRLPQNSHLKSDFFQPRHPYSNQPRHQL